jgi:all-trans-8'-apo-beta-carotenal 15,15'-oxygenase
MLVLLVGVSALRAPSKALLRADWQKAFASQPAEFQSVPLIVVGTPPPGLSGTLFKNGPANFERGGEPYAHWLDGDGYVTALAISGGAARWTARYVETEAYKGALSPIAH